MWRHLFYRLWSVLCSSAHAVAAGNVKTLGWRLSCAGCSYSRGGEKTCLWVANSNTRFWHSHSLLPFFPPFLSFHPCQISYVRLHICVWRRRKELCGGDEHEPWSGDTNEEGFVCCVTCLWNMNNDMFYAYTFVNVNFWINWLYEDVLG
jgi:hypothetical protein